jgi:hypothetical protein
MKLTQVGSVKYATFATRQVRARRGPNARFVAFHVPKHLLLWQRRLEPPPHHHHQRTYPLRPQRPRQRKLRVPRALS